MEEISLIPSWRHNYWVTSQNKWPCEVPLHTSVLPVFADRLVQLPTNIICFTLINKTQPMRGTRIKGEPVINNLWHVSILYSAFLFITVTTGKCYQGKGKLFTWSTFLKVVKKANIFIKTNVKKVFSHERIVYKTEIVSQNCVNLQDLERGNWKGQLIIHTSLRRACYLAP